ncbi:MAG: hypothetical protein QOJ64_1212 [Acidobacteriota bacterium]|nr:hypothetical protein [Acidobacteriota bacterium]
MKLDNSFPRAVSSAPCARILLFAFALALMGATSINSRAQSSNRPVARMITASGSVPAPIQANHRVVPAPAVAPAPPVAANSLERRAFDLVNAERARNRLPLLVWDGTLCRVAREHSEAMARQNFFDHDGPDGDVRDRARANGVSWRSVGENIALNQGYDDPVGLAVNQWMQSSGHRANILRGIFTHSAVGVARAADGRVYLTQVFIMR